MSDSYFGMTKHQKGGFIHLNTDELQHVSGRSISTPEYELAVHDLNDDNYNYEGVENEPYYKMSEDSLEMTSGQESPLGLKQSTIGYPDTDSCVSITPSPDPDCKAKTFDFSMIDPVGDRTNLSAALQVEQEFLDFMFSLPQIQKEAQAKEQPEPPSTTDSTKDVLSPSFNVEEQTKVKLEKKSPSRGGQLIGSTSRVGLDHLDNLCRMMEQLGELREQNSRLQRRVQYLEDLKTLQEMHRDMQDSIAARKTALSLGTISLSDSDLRLEDLNKSTLFSMDSEDSLDPTSVSVSKDKDQLLEIPESSSNHTHHHSSSEDDRRSCIEKDDLLRRPTDKEKKGHKSAWGKVKHMISYNTKRESVRKKSSADSDINRKSGSSIPQSMSVASTKSSIQESAAVVTLEGALEGTGASDPEEYDLDFEPLDPDGASWGDWEGETEGGIWIGATKNNDLPEVDRQILREDHNHRRRKLKPQLTITVPSSESLTPSPVRSKGHGRDRKITPGSSPSKIESKVSPDPSMSPPPSPRRASNWTKVKQAFLTGHNPPNTSQQQQHYLHQQHSHSSVYRLNHRLVLDSPSSQPPSPMKKTIGSTFNFDSGSQPGGLPLYESDSTSGLSPEISPDELLLREPRSPEINQVGTAARHASLPSAAAHFNLIDLQRTLTGEFNKKLQEWEKLKSHQVSNSGWGDGAAGFGAAMPPNAEGHLPQDFKKKLQEWEKMKGKEKYRPSDASSHSYNHHSIPPLLNHHTQHPVSGGQDNLKMKMQNEDDLPPDFKKKLTEWEIRKALVGKGGQPNVDKLQKNLGEDFNKKMAEWERMKAVGHGKISVLDIQEAGGLPGTPTSNIPKSICGDRTGHGDTGALRLRELARLTHLAGVAGVGTGGALVAAYAGLDRKGSSTKVKKSKAGKVEKQFVSKTEASHKNRDKELLWLEKELSKIDREKQRLEREKEKFLEREARLEKMRHAMRQGPAEKKEIYIKTSTGEFRFEGISQTFTKKLYEWEERRGIRPESSTFVLLDPNYKAPEKNGSPDRPKPRSPELKRIVRSRSESSLADMGTPSILPHQSSISLNELETEESAPLQNENKSASEPTLSAEETSIAKDSSKCAVMVQVAEEEVADEDRLTKRSSDERRNEEESDRNFTEDSVDDYLENGEMKEVEEPRSRCSLGGGGTYTPYAPAEITKLIDSSGSDDNIARHLRDVDDDITSLTANEIMLPPLSTYSNDRQLKRSDSQRSEESYRSLLHENMTLLGKLKEQESLCRALETQMGDIDTKMDNVADQHHKTLEKLHHHVTIMKNSESSGRMSDFIGDEELSDDADEAESNQRLIEQLKARIVELELKGDRLMEEKESLDRAFKLHKEHETEIAESLLLRIRELQDAGAEVNIQTVQCQTEDCATRDDSKEISGDQRLNVIPLPEMTSPHTKKRRRKKREEQRKTEEGGKPDDEEKERSEEESEMKKADKEVKELNKRKKKAPPKKVQKLHSLTADLLFQAKRLEGALISRHHFHNEDKFDPRLNVQTCRVSRKRSLKGRSSLRLSNDESKDRVLKKPPKDPASGRTWSSIEAIACAEDDKMGESATWEGRAASLASESQDLLAMNAELSRMARELRKEMMNLWSFRESTSPESNCSDSREQVIMARRSKSSSRNGELCSSEEEGGPSGNRDDFNNCWLAEEAMDVLKKIASLEHTHSAPEFQPSSPNQSCCKDENDLSHNEETVKPKFEITSPEIKEPLFNPWESCNTSALEDSKEESNQRAANCETEELIQSWWDVPQPKKRKNKLRIVWSAAEPEEVVNVENHEDDEVKNNLVEHNGSLTKKDETASLTVVSDDEDHHHCTNEISADFDIPLPVQSGTTLGDLLRAEESQRELKGTEGGRRYSSSPRSSHNQRSLSRISNSTSEDDNKNCLDRCLFIREDDIAEDESRAGTLRTNASSTIRSDILSSSFEYDDKDVSSFKEDNDKKTYDSFSWKENSHMTYPPAKKSDFTQIQLEKVGLMIAEQSKRLNHNNGETDSLKINKEQRKEHEEKYREENWGHREEHSEKHGGEHREDSGTQESNTYETEVKLDVIQRKRKLGGLRTRRVSDTQIPYDKEAPPTQSLSAQQNNDALYKEKYFYYRKVDRTPSIRRNQSESDVLGIQLEGGDSTNVFVTTHRTIFTVSSESNSAKNTVTPTFLYDIEKSDIIDASELNIDRGLKNCNSGSMNKIGVLTQSPELLRKSSIDNESNISASVNGIDSSCSSPIRCSSTPCDGDSTCPSTPKSPTFFRNFSTSFSHTSSPVESKKKVLEAANEASPTVKNMIDQYNKRITEKQELLINPFQPGDPYRRSAKSMSSTNKSLAILRKGRSAGSRQSNFDAEKIVKSQSTSVLQMYQSSYDKQYIQRSISGTSAFQNNFGHSTASTSTDTLIDSQSRLQSNQSTSSFGCSGMDLSTDTIANNEEYDLSHLPKPNRETEGELRACRVKRAKEEFLARGVAPAKVKTKDNVDQFSLNVGNGNSVLEGPKKPPRTLNTHQLNIPRKESFRRQSEGAIPDEEPLPPHVFKSASSGVIELRQRQGPRPSSSKENRRSYFSSPSKGIFKLFKRTKAKDSKDLATVQHLCRQSLVVDASHANRDPDPDGAASTSRSPTRDRHKSQPSKNDESDYPDEARGSLTLPRQDSPHEDQSTASRSCPSSPVSPRKSKAAQWIAKSKRIFQSRSPSPNQKPS